MFFGLGLQEILLVLAIALIVVGPSKLPQLAHSLGKFVGSFRKTLDEVRNEIDNGIRKSVDFSDDSPRIKSEETAIEKKS